MPGSQTVRRVAELEHPRLLLELEGEPLGERHTDLAHVESVTTARLSSPRSPENWRTVRVVRWSSSSRQDPKPPTHDPPPATSRRSGTLPEPYLR
jgi:hypothetical protein